MAARRRRGDQSGGVRKVRAPQRRVAGNTRPSRDEDQCHSDDAVADPRAGRRSETGKLHPEQGQIGGRNPCGVTRRGRGALPSPRVGRMSRRVTAGLRWMAIRDGVRRRDRTRRTDRPRWSPPVAWTPDPACPPPGARFRTFRCARSPPRRWLRPGRPTAGRSPCRARGQSSSGRKMCGAVHALQIGIAASRWPSGIGSRRSGSRHSTSYSRSAPDSIWISRRNVHRLIRCGASRYASASGGTIGSGRAIWGAEPRAGGLPDQAPDSSTGLFNTATHQTY